MEKQEIEMLVVSESAYGPELAEHVSQRFVIYESGVNEDGISSMWKISGSGEIMKQLLGIYTEIADTQLPMLRRRTTGLCLSGIIRPGEDCMQTSFGHHDESAAGGKGIPRFT